LLIKDVDYLHISAHGKRLKTKRGTVHALTIGRNVVIKPDDIRKWKPKAKNIFLSACGTGYDDLLDAFFDFDNKKKGTIIAPAKDVPFDEAFLLALQFHRGAFLEGSQAKAKRYFEDSETIDKTYYHSTYPKT
jgi:hypothetical protein